MRSILAMSLLGLLIAPAVASNVSPPLTVEAARILVASTIMPGKVFAVAGGRYYVTRVNVRSRGQTFTVDITIQPLEKVK